LWQAWFTAHGIDPAEVLLTTGYSGQARRHGHRDKIVWLEYGGADGEQITVHERLTWAPRARPVPS